MSVSEYALIGTDGTAVFYSRPCTRTWTRYKKEVFQVFQVFQGVQGSLGGGVYGGMIVAIGAKSYTNCVFSYKKFGNCEKML